MNKVDKMQQVLTLFKSEGNEIQTKQIAEVYNAMQTMGIAKDLDASQMYIFLKYCMSLKLNPLLKQIHCVTYRNKDGSYSMTPIISYNEYIKRASRNPLYQLPQTKLIGVDENGKINNLNDFAIEVIVKRKGDETEFKKVYFFREWRKNSPVWNERPVDMLYVRALKNSLAQAYPEEVGDFEIVEDSAQIQQDQNQKVSKSAKALFDKEVEDEQNNNA